MIGVLRLGRCCCGVRTAEHFDAKNHFVPCATALRLQAERQQVGRRRARRRRSPRISLREVAMHAQTQFQPTPRPTPFQFRVANLGDQALELRSIRVNGARVVIEQTPAGWLAHVRETRCFWSLESPKDLLGKVLAHLLPPSQPAPHQVQDGTPWGAESAGQSLDGAPLSSVGFVSNGY